MSPTADAAALIAAVAAAVDGARAAELDPFNDASSQLAQLDIERVGIVQAAAIRSLLEQRHPDGLDGDDVRAILTRCATAAGWLPDFSVDGVLLVLSGALGMVDPEQQPQLGRELLARHASLVIADLSTGPEIVLADHLDYAVREIRRAEIMEMP